MSRRLPPPSTLGLSGHFTSLSKYGAVKASRTQHRRGRTVSCFEFVGRGNRRASNGLHAQMTQFPSCCPPERHMQRAPGLTTCPPLGWGYASCQGERLVAFPTSCLHPLRLQTMNQVTLLRQRKRHSRTHTHQNRRFLLMCVLFYTLS